MSRIAFSLLVGLSLLAGCTGVDVTESDPLTWDQFVYDKAEVAKAQQVVFALPGALSSIEIFRRLEPELPDRTALVYLRLPGMDGRPLQGRIDLEKTAKEIASLVAHYDVEQVTLVGVSTGGAIALEAAKRIGPKAKVAAISSALPYPETRNATLRGLYSNLGISMRLGTLDRRRLWEEYYKVLLYGKDYRKNPNLRSKAEATLATNKDQITVPTTKLARAHSGDLLDWRFDETESLRGIDVVFFHGTEDPVYPFAKMERFSKIIPGARLVAIEGHGHLLYVSDKELFSKIGATLGTW